MDEVETIGAAGIDGDSFAVGMGLELAAGVRLVEDSLMNPLDGPLEGSRTGSAGGRGAAFISSSPSPSIAVMDAPENKGSGGGEAARDDDGRSSMTLIGTRRVRCCGGGFDVDADAGEVLVEATGNEGISLAFDTQESASDSDLDLRSDSPSSSSVCSSASSAPLQLLPGS